MDSEQVPTGAGADWLVGGGELGELIRSRDWSGTPLGCRERWPQPLKTIVSTMIGSEVPMAVVWGPERLLLYNDAYRVVAADRHPQALGRPSGEPWSADPIRGEDVVVEIDRRGHREHVALRASPCPVRLEDGTEAGTLVLFREHGAADGGDRPHGSDRRDAASLPLRPMLDSLEEGVLFFDRSGRAQQMNEAARTAFGEALTPTSVEGRDTGLLLRQADETPLTGDDHPARVAVRTGQPQRAVLLTTLLGDGDQRWFRVNAQPVVDAGGQVAGAFASFLDVTHERRVEAERDRLAQLQALAIEATRIGWCTYDPAAKLVRYDERCRELLGLRGSHCTGEELVSIVHPDDVPHALARIRAALDARTRAPYCDEYRIVAPDGSIRWIEAHGVASFDGEGPARRAKAFTGTILDITDRKEAELALRDREARLASIYSAVTDVLFLLAVDGGDSYRFESVNRAFLETTGLPAERVIGHRVEEVIPEPSLTLVRERYREAIVTRKPVRWQETTDYPTGQLVGDVAVTPLVAPNGRVTHLVGAVHDITELKRREMELREADRRRTEFLAILSHELRNPLAPIRNSLYILDRAAPGGEQARRARAVIARQVDQLTRLVADLLDVSRITRGQIALQRERIELRALATQTVEDYRSLFARGGIRLELDVAPSEVWTWGDPARLAQAIGNLLQNAAKFTEPGGATMVSVGLEPPRSQAVITVRDTGIGIEPEVMRRLFQPFAQANIPLDRRNAGLGLGLAIVKGVVELHAGTVRADSEGPGQGATFTIRLPLDTAEAARQAPAQGPRRAGGSRRVLIIEDNLDAASSLREALELGGHSVFVARSGPEGIVKARTERPDVVLCDIGLPGMDGYAVARAMRADPQLGALAMIALTGYAQPDDVVRARSAGFDAHLAKPPDLDALEELLATTRATRR